MATARSIAGMPQPTTCEKIVMTGEVSSAHEWRASIGQGWVFRVMPIQPGNSAAGKTGSENAAYSGWDLVVDREQPAGFPDALLLATPPFDSISEREVGTTFGVRAQDAIGWNPRSFRFLTDPAVLRQSQQLYHRVNHNGQAGMAGNPSPEGTFSQASGAGPAQQVRKLMEWARHSSAGQFLIVDARLTPGVADAAPFAENWAVRSARTPHAFEPAPGAKSTSLGTLNWIRFSITLWLPGTWKAPAALHAAPGACSE